MEKLHRVFTTISKKLYSKGTKFTQKTLQEIDYININPNMDY
jgi:hypothetical protein